MKRLILFCTVLALALLSLTANAQTEFGLHAIGGSLNYVIPEDPLDATFGIDVVAEFADLGNGFILEGGLSYWDAQYDETELFGNTYTVSLQDVALRAGTRYLVGDGRTVPFVGGGIGIHSYTAKAEYNGVTYATGYSDGTEFGLYLLGGVETELSQNLLGNALLRFDLADADVISINLGLSYLLGE
jgi:opacity protein-like surface antigen